MWNVGGLETAGLSSMFDFFLCGLPLSKKSSKFYKEFKKFNSFYNGLDSHFLFLNFFLPLIIEIILTNLYFIIRVQFMVHTIRYLYLNQTVP